jgi:hypothetical protein
MSPTPARPTPPHISPRDRAKLLTEAERYLAAVEVFRAEGRAPEWRGEPAAGGSRPYELSPRA